MAYARKINRAYKRARHKVWLDYAVPQVLLDFARVTHEARARLWDGVAEFARRYAEANPETTKRWDGKALYFDVVINSHEQEHI